LRGRLVRRHLADVRCLLQQLRRRLLLRPLVRALPRPRLLRPGAPPAPGAATPGRLRHPEPVGGRPRRPDVVARPLDTAHGAAVLAPPASGAAELARLVRPHVARGPGARGPGAGTAPGGPEGGLKDRALVLPVSRPGPLRLTLSAPDFVSRA